MNYNIILENVTFDLTRTKSNLLCFKNDMLQFWLVKRAVSLQFSVFNYCIVRIYTITVPIYTFNTYLLGARETVCLETRDRRSSTSRVHKTYCFPEVPVNKCFIIYQ
jgi:hypothetical protein